MPIEGPPSKTGPSVLTISRYLSMTASRLNFAFASVPYRSPY